MRFSEFKDRKRSLRAYRDWAARVWKSEVAACGTAAYSDEYARGFSDGFTDYCYAGGTGEPPPVPPREFWNLTARSPEGHVAADDWFAGYRHGASAAREGGYRDRAIVHSSLVYPAIEEMLPPSEVSGAEAEDLGPPPTPSPDGEPMGPEFDNSAPSPEPPESTVPTGPPPDASPNSRDDPSDEAPGNLPAPTTSAADRAMQSSVLQFKSAMQNATERQATPAGASLSVNDFVKPTSAQMPHISFEDNAIAGDRATESTLKLLNRSE